MTEDPDRADRSAAGGEEPASSSGGGGAEGGPQLGEVMGQVARALQEQHGDVSATLEAITTAAVGSVPGADECGVSVVVRRTHVESRAPTGDMPLRIDKIQERVGEGPCLEAIAEHATVRIHDIDHEERWPRFAAEAREEGMRSMLCFQLFVAGDTLGALNLYSRQANAFTEESETIGLVFASHASIALAGAQKEEHLRAAIGTRDLIGQAKGILMERFKITAVQAFEVLARSSSHTNRKLEDVADELCATGTLPGPHGDRLPSPS
jgi:GAF domain-containing protein